MFQLRPRTADMPKKMKKKPIEGFRDEKQQQQQQQQQQIQQSLPFLLQISSGHLHLMLLMHLMLLLSYILDSFVSC